MGYGRYVVTRGLNALLVLLVALLISVFIFSALEIQELETRAYEELQNYARGLKGLPPEEMKKRIEEYREYLFNVKYKLNEPLYIKAFRWMIRALTLDFGEARQRYPAYGATADVRSILLVALGRTALLFTTAYIIAVAIGIMVGLFAAYKRGGIFDRSLSVLALTTYSMPMYWLGMLLILFFAYTLKIFPSAAWEYIPESVKANLGSLILWYLHHMTLPLITIIFVAFGGLAWYARNIALSAFQEDFVMMAQAKGLPDRDILFKHVLRVISPPITTMSTFTIIFSFFGAIISEIVFQWPGMGRLYYTALANSDTPVVTGITYLSIMLIVITKYILDLIYGLLDPRIKTA
ncbi:MAG TPA: ABC transporter permease [Desulfurococcales archaeon]|nr:ABC transporter permease [Desulfurococcales archaeon]